MKQLRLNAFLMNCVSHLSPGLWRHPQDRSLNYTNLQHWVDLAQTLERGLFDGIFLADVLGVYDTYRGSIDASLAQAAQVPVNDPLQVIPVMAYATKHLGFGVTASVSFEHPFPFARRMSTLDHLTNGRAAWNIVTSYLESGARNIGSKGLMSHDDRYDMADEYMDVVYKLWEGSWAEDAVRRNKEGGYFVDPTKVMPVRHEGQHFSVPGIHLCEPSPQRTPLLYQAGSSVRGKRFAARHAECVFTGCPTIPVLREMVKDIRDKVTDADREPADVLIFNMQTVILGETNSSAEKKYAELKSYIDREAVLALFSGATGIDLSKFSMSDPLGYVKTHGGQSVVDVFTIADGSREWKIEELAEWCGIGGRGPVIVGSARKVADELEHWMDETDVDGFNLSFATMPGTFQDVVDILVPELQRRGRYKTHYEQGTLREKMFGCNARLSDAHYGSRYRHLDRETGASSNISSC